MTLFERRSKAYRDFLDGMPHVGNYGLCRGCSRGHDGIIVVGSNFVRYMAVDVFDCYRCLRWSGFGLN